MNRADGADAPYWEGLAAGRLMLPRCDDCHRWMWPAGRRCGACGTIGVHWIERPMKARVYSWTRTWHRFGLTEGLDLPFTTVVAEVEDCAVRLLGRLHDPDRIDPVIGEALIGRPAETIVGNDRIPTILWSRAA
ncbi:MAG: zinc ribbon domain-containing protein [Candidatus Sphingomonas colombiensis]|nr:zinc ribbon domain-containing protein [Sphingomonas sp.]WEK43864.1 MAG: zinc ribbon domain-containing protein [Sphingomonas sp.]